MPSKPTYLTLPIYSIATYNQYYYLSGGGGGKTGIKNEIFIFKGQISREPINRIETDNRIVENMVSVPTQKLLIASANQDVKVFGVEDEGLKLVELFEFQADFAPKHSTLYTLSYLPQKNILGCGGEDAIVRFFTIAAESKSAEKFYELKEHSNSLKSMDHNKVDLFATCDSTQIIVLNILKKSIIRRVFQDQLLPEKCHLQSSHFINPGKQELIICHFIMRGATYLTKQDSRLNLQTSEISRDQSCLTAYHRGMKTLGIACGNGSTYLAKVNSLRVIGSSHAHSYVITGATISRGGRFITGTPECSYNVQQINEPLCPSVSCLAPFSLIIALSLIFVIANQSLLSLGIGQL